MSTTKNKIAFLMTKVESLDLVLSNRIRNSFRNDGIITVFSALAQTEKELLRGPNMGPKSVKEWADYVSTAGFKPGDTKDFLQRHREFFYNTKQPHHTEKNVTRLPSDENTISQEDFAAKIQEFLDLKPLQVPQAEKPSLTEFNIVSIIDLFPEEAKKNLSLEFLTAVANNPEVIKGVQEILAKAVQRNLGFE